MDQFLVDANIRLLKDETVLINDSFYLIGRLDASCRQKSGIIRKTAAELIRPLDASRPVIVIDHQPSELSELAAAGCRSRPLRPYTRRPALPRQYHDPDRLEKFLRQARPWQYDQYRYLRCRRLGAGHANRDRREVAEVDVTFLS